MTRHITQLPFPQSRHPATRSIIFPPFSCSSCSSLNPTTEETEQVRIIAAASVQIYQCFEAIVRSIYGVLMNGVRRQRNGLSFGKVVGDVWRRSAWHVCPGWNACGSRCLIQHHLNWEPSQSQNFARLALRSTWRFKRVRHDKERLASSHIFYTE